METAEARASTRGERWLGVAGAALLAFIVVLGLGRAAARPGGMAVGLPGPVEIGVAILAVLACMLILRGVSALKIALGLAPLVAVLAACASSGLRAFSGSPLLALAAAPLVLALWRHPPPFSARFFFPCVLLVYGAVAERVQTKIGPEGDGPHYLMVADSLLHDHDLDLAQDFRDKRYQAFYGGELAPHKRVRGRHGETYSLHAVGLSILILPAYALAGYRGASFFLALLAAVLAREIRELVHQWTRAPGLAEGVAWVVAFSPPVLHYVGVIFTEVPAALLIALVLRRGRDLGQASLARALGIGLAIAALPWLNVRFVLPAALLLGFVLLARPALRSAVALALPVVLSALGVALYHWILYGFWNPGRVYGSTPELALANAPTGLLGLLFDQEFGLLVYAPVYALAAWWLVRPWRYGWRMAVTAAGLVVAIMGMAALWPMWRGGFNPPGRFLVPLVPVLALGVAAALRGSPRVGAALLIGWSLWTGAWGVLDPPLVHRDRDGTAPLFRAASGALEWTTLLPSFVVPPGEWAYDRAYDDRQALTALWAVALALAVFGPRRPRATAPRLALAVLGAVGAAGVAQTVSTGRSDGRDAVRLIGRPALALPRGQSVRDALWEASDLRWGGDYCDPRLAIGVALGSRLPLPPGRYALAIQVDGPMPEVAPAVAVRPEGQPDAQRGVPLAPGAGRLEGLFDVLPGERAIRLMLHGGSAFWLESVRLTPLSQAPGVPPGTAGMRPLLHRPADRLTKPDSTSS